jgi:hypothetical protein
MKLSCLFAAVLLHASLGGAAILLNGDFEAGTLAGWTTFTTYNGSLGTADLPDANLFDTRGNGQASLSARFQVGETAYIGDGHTSQGGGIYQSFNTALGSFVVSADLASQNLSGSINSSPGKFDLYLDGSLMASRNFDALFGWIYPGQTQRSSISTTLPFTAGTHEIRFLITRPWVTGDTPYQYLDNVQIVPVPEPAVSTVFLIGILVLSFGVPARHSNRAHRSHSHL